MAEPCESGQGEYTKDGSVDLKGNPVLRSKRGGWTACGFVVVYEVFERMAYYGISTNLVIYLTNKLHEGTVTSANNVTNWVGTVWMTPIIGAYVADAHLGRYWTFIIASIIYLSGMCLLTMAVSLRSLRPPPCGANTNDPNCNQKATSLQLGVFFFALYILAIGTGGTKPNISTIGADQFDEFDPKERTHKLSFFNWWMFSIFFGTLFANTVLVYIQDNVGWTLGYALPTLGLAISVAIFIAGTPFYRHKRPSGSPFTRMARVLVAAARKWRVTLPNDPKELHEIPQQSCRKDWPNNTLDALLGDASGGDQTDAKNDSNIVCNLHPEHDDRSDAFLEVAKIEFFYDQAPEGMKSLGTSYSMTSLGVGSFLSSVLLSTVSHITEKHGHQGWILNNLNASHLDYYYAFFATLNFLNFIFFLLMCRFYVYRAEISQSDPTVREEEALEMPTLRNHVHELDSNG
ncbi:putative protein NRT1/ PTR FAMILY 5.1 [Cocos nucifera]|uniref:Uncharacterized protein n=1 Tax=Cocos nucifera TaxID=13894 RepID=A0A8K0ILK1_COCNU|nr:putative protein NRT1/ PTR FAMILY 5.1 [Cocos nucifera]